MLEAVGFPVAVNPETRLAAIARKRGWLVEQWSKAPGGPRPLLPIGPLLSARGATGRATVRHDEGDRTMKEPGDEGAADRAEPGPLRRGAGRRIAGAGRGRHVRPARPRRRRLAGPARDRRGYGCGRAWPASAGAICRPSTAPPAATSSRSSASPSPPATKWWPTPTATSAWCWSRSSAAWREGIEPPCVACARGDLGQLRAAGLRAPLARAADRVTAATPAAAGAPTWSPTQPAPPGAERHERRGRGDRRAHRLRGPRRPAPPHHARVTPWSCSAPGRSAC